jgi:hypothetical protein
MKELKLGTYAAENIFDDHKKVQFKARFVIRFYYRSVVPDPKKVFPDKNTLVNKGGNILLKSVRERI